VFRTHVREWGRRTAPLVLLSVAACAALAPGALAAPAGTTHYPDLQTVIPTNSFSVVQGTDGREFRYTHLVYNAGPGPLEIQPQYNVASGSYQGQQQLFTHNAANQWSQVATVRVPDAFVFHAAHGHFHFPLAAFGLYGIAGDGGIGAPVSVSPKNGFCIDDSYIYDNTVPHAGTFVGVKGSCGDPTTLRGLTVGAADEYDFRDPGQAIPFVGVPDGTYWFRAMSDPNNDLVEANEANNETDVKVTIAGGIVTVGEVRHPDTTPPPITWGAPADGARVLGNVNLSAATATTGGVQFVVDGNVVGTATSSPYSLSWDSTTVVDGEHWVAARTTDAQGRTNTTAPVVLNVSNSTPPPLPGVLSVDATKSIDGHGNVTTAALGASENGDVLVAFVSSDGPSSGQTVTVSGGGLSWSLVRRANTRLGTSEIWKATAPASAAGTTVTSTQAKTAFDQSLTVIAFSGAGGVGASSGAGAATGAPRTTLTTTVAGSWVFGTGNDWDGATTRTLGAGQSMRHQWLDTASGDTFWAQSQASPTPNAGTLVAIDDTAPTNHQWNMAAVEVLPGTPTAPPPPDTTAPQVSVSDPKPATTVSGIVALGATASDNVGVTRVQFKVDGQPVGGPVTSPPFQASWDTRTASAGSHTVTAEATDAAGNTGVSAGVTVTVDNSAPPPAAIGIDKLVVRHAKGTLASPALTTTTAGDALLAFVSFDGPNSASSQSATLTGAGLPWTLVKRSNTQAGTSEIWSAKATTTLTNQTVTATPLRSGFDGSLTVIAFRNAAGTGVAGASAAASGAPDIFLPGIPTASWVFAVGNDWDRAVARTPVAGQQLQDQWIDTGSGDTFWVQSTSAPNTAPGLVTIHDSAPTNDRWNYAAVEVTPVAGTATATIALGVAASARGTTTDVGYYCTLHQPPATAL
jgi:Bacterial Ig domain/Lysyl oxidase